MFDVSSLFDFVFSLSFESRKATAARLHQHYIVHRLMMMKADASRLACKRVETIVSSVLISAIDVVAVIVRSLSFAAFLCSDWLILFR